MTTTQTEPTASTNAPPNTDGEKVGLRRGLDRLRSVANAAIACWHMAFASCSIAAAWSWSPSAIVACLASLLILPILVATLAAATVLVAWLVIRLEEIVDAKPGGSLPAGNDRRVVEATAASRSGTRN